MCVCVTGGVVHGLPKGPLHGDALGKTDQLLEAVGNHVVFGCRRPRYVAGDWSHDMSQLSTLRAWEKAGFRDLQTIAFERWGVSPSPTCKSVTRKDFVYVSAELARLLVSVHVNEACFADHAALWGEFRVPSQRTVVQYKWPQPSAVPWGDVAPLSQAV